MFKLVITVKNRIFPLKFRKQFSNDLPKSSLFFKVSKIFTLKCLIFLHSLLITVITQPQKPHAKTLSR